MTHWELNTPEVCLAAVRERIPRYIQLTYAAAVALGLATHLYIFANKFANHDDLNQMFYADYGTASGRWLLPPVLRLDGNLSIPWLIGLLSVLFLAGVACFTVALLRIRRPLGCIVTAALIVTFPTVTATFGYMFTADGYFLSLLMAAFGAYAAVNWGWRGSALGALSIMLSLSIYQSYFPVAAVLMVGALLFEILDGEHSFRDLLFKGLRLVATLAAALVVYMLAVRITSRNIGLTDYEGISDMGKISLLDLPKLIFESYRTYFSFFLRNDYGCHFNFLKYAFLITAIGTMVLGAMLLWKRRLGAPRTVLALALAAVYPLAGGCIYVMVPNGYVHIHMLYGMVYILVVPIALAEYAGPDLWTGGMRSFHAAVSWATLLTMILTSYSYAVTDNNAYLKADLGTRQCAAYSNRLLERVEACDGYEPGMDVVLVGSDIREEAMDPTPEASTAWLVGIYNIGDLRTSSSYSKFLRYYLGFIGPVYTGESETAQAFAALEQVQAMPIYPEAGSIQVIDNTVVVKLN